MASAPRRPEPGPDALELRQLRTFLAVAEERSFTRAAERLHLAQQGVSAAIRRLEEALGVRLFERSTRHVALTPAGELLAARAPAILAAADEALAEVRLAAEGRAGRLAVGFSTAAGRVPLVRDALRRFAASAPDVELQTLEHDFADPSAGLADGRTSAAFIFGPLPVGGLRSVVLVAEPPLLAVAPDHPLAARRSVTPADLEALPWLRVPAPDGPWRDRWFPRRAGVPAGATIRTADEWVAAVEAGRGAALTMPTVMRDFAGARVAVVPVESTTPATILLAWRASDPDPLVRRLVRSVRSMVREGAAAGPPAGDGDPADRAGEAYIEGE